MDVQMGISYLVHSASTTSHDVSGTAGTSETAGIVSSYYRGIATAGTIVELLVY